MRRGPGEKPNLDSLFPKNILVKITTKFSEVPTFQYFPQTFCLNKKEAFGPFIAPILSAANEPLIKKKKKKILPAPKYKEIGRKEEREWEWEREIRRKKKGEEGRIERQKVEGKKERRERSNI